MTAPFGPVLETALKETVQGGTLTAHSGRVVSPQFFCCLSGLNVDKDPVPVLIVDPTDVCIGDNVSVDYSHSWSPSSTIATWEVDWGDGNTSGGAWPGAGSVNHPMGGYTLNVTYTITLTVTDLIGAYASTSYQVIVWDCETIPIELFGGCGASGVWYSANGGYSWDTAGLAGIVIYDLKPNWFTFGTGKETIELWAATANGVYKTVNGGVSWKHLTLPPITDLGLTPDVAAVCPSKYDRETVYVVAHNAVSKNVWLYKTVDGGDTWETPLLIAGTTSASFEKQLTTACFAEALGEVYAAGRTTALDLTTLWERNDATGVWDDKGLNNCDGVHRVMHNGVSMMAGGATYLWGVGASLDPDIMVCFDINTIARYNGTCWTGTGGCACFESVRYWESAGGVLIGSATQCGALFGPLRFVSLFAIDGTFIDGYEFYTAPTLGMGVHDAIGCGDHFYAALRSGVGNAGTIWRWEYHTASPPAGNPDLWTMEWSDVDYVTDWAVHNNTIWAITTGTTDKLLVRNAGVWSDDTVACPDNISSVWSNGSYLYVTAGHLVYRRTSGGYLEVCDFGVNLGDFVEHDNNWYAFGNTGVAATTGIYKCGLTSNLLVPDVGRTHIIDETYNGLYVYVALLDATTNEPVIVQVTEDLASSAIVYNPGAGTWGGVACDLYDPEWVWIFGDFGAATKVQVSPDYGVNWIDLTDGGWGASEVVRPLMISPIDMDDVIVVLNDALETHQSKDAGGTWIKVGDTAFVVHCAVRDWYNDTWLWLGRSAANATHLQFSPNVGVDWLERSGGFSASAPVTALTITG